MILEVDIIRRTIFTFPIEVKDDSYEEIERAKEEAYKIYEQNVDNETINDYFNDEDIDIQI